MPNAQKLTPDELNRLSIADPDEIRKSRMHSSATAASEIAMQQTWQPT
jgi:hypothetical protein